jgi:hypothetical protein
MNSIKLGLLFFFCIISSAWNSQAMCEIVNDSNASVNARAVALAIYHAKKSIPKTLPSHIRKIDGVEFRFYGYTHGIFRLPQKYRKFVFASINKEIANTQTCDGTCAILVEQDLVRGLPPSNLYV